MGGRITSLTAKAGRMGRVHVHLDGTFAFSLARILAARLRLGQELSGEEIETLQREDAAEVAYRKALTLISRRPRAERELRVRFDRNRVPPEIQDVVIDRLRLGHQIDDRGFAEAWVENRVAFRPRAARMLRFELRQKGVPSSVIEAALEGYDEQAAALAAGRKASRRLSQLSEIDFKKRMSQYLSRRGFDHATISPVIERMWREITVHRNESEGNL